MRNAVAPLSGTTPIPLCPAGVGLRLPHLAEVATVGPTVPWLEIHPENFLANSHAKELLIQISDDHDISLHTVGISIGSATGLDREHLSRIRELVSELDPFLVSGHLAWSTHGDVYLNDLLPIPYDDESLRLVAAHLSEVQETLGRPFLIENPSSYLAFSSSTMTEIEFMNELSTRTGCRLLCDISNIFVSGHNLGFDPYAYIDAYPAHAVDEIHLGGYSRESDGADKDSEVLIDTHSDHIADEVWPLYAHALRRFGHRPTLIEWDNSLPDYLVLIQEAEHANDIAIDIAAEKAAYVTAG
jgi:hypothetical protein